MQPENNRTRDDEVTSEEKLWIIQYYCTKSLNVIKLADKRFTIIDVFGNACIPFDAQEEADLCRSIFEKARVRPILYGNRSLVREKSEWADTDIPYRIEEIYIARLPDFYRIWLCGSGDWMVFDRYSSSLPIFYLDFGYGTGSKVDFEKLHAIVVETINRGRLPFGKDLLFAHLMREQLGRICDDIVALIHRASRSLQEILRIQRQVIIESAMSLEQLQTTQVLQVNQSSQQIASLVTVACISLCTSLDLAAKLVYFVNENAIPPHKFRPAQGKHFEELKIIKAKGLPADVITKIQKSWEFQKPLKELIQFRHDLVHSTTALELERKLYVGIGSNEVDNLGLHYSFQPWRDTDETGQPHRSLGRDYFSSQNIDIEWALYVWLNAVIDGHINAGTQLLQFFETAIKTPTHRLSGT